MSVRIRLSRTGKVCQPCHRIVVTDIRHPRDGRIIENIGFYDPRHKTETILLERADFWVGRGAQPTATVSAIMKRARAGVKLGAVKPQEAVKIQTEEPAKATS